MGDGLKIATEHVETTLKEFTPIDRRGPVFMHIGDRYIPIGQIIIARDFPDRLSVWLRSTDGGQWREDFTGPEQREAREALGSMCGP